MEQATRAYGLQLVIDGYEANPYKLAALDVVYDFVDTCPSVVGMTKISPPYVFRFTPQHPHLYADGGISGFVIIAESHISVHTYPERAFVVVDMFSCKWFDADRALKHAIDAFDIARAEHQLFDRGLDFPHDVDQAQRIVNELRRRLTSANLVTGAGLWQSLTGDVNKL